jgi:S-adenosylmethionine hydrolase
MSPVITLTTDFGNQDAYVASIKGAILNINQKAIVVDITHTIETYNIEKAAYIISTVYHYFPTGTIHVVIIDPGVGSQRKSVIVQTPSAIFVAPDNGVLSYIINELEQPLSHPTSATITELQQKHIPKNAQAITITNPNYWKHPVSTTFHGRDIFAPVAAHLSLGTPIQKFGEKLDLLNVLPIPYPHPDHEGNINGAILYIDHFGNLITNIREQYLPQGKITITIGHHTISRISTYYHQSTGLIAIMNSSGYLEVAHTEGSAARLLGSRVGDQVKISQG